MLFSPRPPKEILLPEVTRLALEGHSGQAIAQRLGLPKRTVNHWLHGLREEWIAKAREDGAAVIGVSLARLDAIYREAMEEWHDSRKDLEVRLVEDIQVADDSHPAKQKRSVRTQAQGRNTACLARAIDAVKAACLIK